MTAAERQKALYERRRAAGWKKSWIDPKTAEVAADLGGIERLGWRYERMAEKIELLETRIAAAEQKSRLRRWLRRWL